MYERLGFFINNKVKEIIFMRVGEIVLWFRGRGDCAFGISSVEWFEIFEED